MTPGFKTTTSGPIPNPLGEIPAGKIGFGADVRKSVTKPNSCGHTVSSGEIRFYCTADVTATSWWKTNSASSMTGIFPSSFDKPDFWDDVVPLEVTKNVIDAQWDCCCKKPWYTLIVGLFSPSVFPKK